MPQSCRNTENETCGSEETRSPPLVKPRPDQSRENHFHSHRRDLGHPFHGDRDRVAFIRRGIHILGEAAIAQDRLCRSLRKRYRGPQPGHSRKAGQSNRRDSKGQPYFVFFFTMSIKVCSDNGLREILSPLAEKEQARASILFASARRGSASSEGGE